MASSNYKHLGYDWRQDQLFRQRRDIANAQLADPVSKGGIRSYHGKLQAMLDHLKAEKDDAIKHVKAHDALQGLKVFLEPLLERIASESYWSMDKTATVDLNKMAAGLAEELGDVQKFPSTYQDVEKFCKGLEELMMFMQSFLASHDSRAEDTEVYEPLWPLQTGRTQSHVRKAMAVLLAGATVAGEISYLSQRSDQAPAGAAATAPATSGAKTVAPNVQPSQPKKVIPPPPPLEKLH